jgi:hypothetical protein
MEITKKLIQEMLSAGRVNIRLTSPMSVTMDLYEAFQIATGVSHQVFKCYSIAARTRVWNPSLELQNAIPLGGTLLFCNDGDLWKSAVSALQEGDEMFFQFETGNSSQAMTEKGVSEDMLFMEVRRPDTLYGDVIKLRYLLDNQIYSDPLSSFVKTQRKVKAA